MTCDLSGKQKIETGYKLIKCICFVGNRIKKSTKIKEIDEYNKYEMIF